MKAVKWILGLVGLLLLLVLLVALAVPRWLSSGGGRQFLLGQVNDNMEGSVEIDALRLGWFSSPSLSGVVVNDEAGRPLVRVRKVQGSRSLFQLARNYKELGEWRVQRPDIFVYLDEPTPEPERDPPPKPEPAPPAVPEPVEPRPAEPIRIPELRVQVMVEEGTLYKVDPGQAPQAVVQNLKADLQMSGTQRPLTYELSFDAGAGAGTLRGSGSVDLAPLAVDPMGVLIETSLAISDWSIADALALGAAAGAPQGEGTLHAKLKMKGSAAAGLDLDVKVELKQLAISGSRLQGDTPRLGDVEAVLVARLEGDDMRISQARLVSDLVSLSARAELSGGEPTALDATGLVDLAAISRQFPNTLGLKEDLSIAQGLVNLAAKLDLEDDVARIDASVRMDRLEGMSEGRPLVWDQPVEIELRALKGADVLRVEQLTATMPFLQAEGSGDLADFALSINSDLGLALAEAGKFVDLQEWAMAGTLGADVRIRSDAEATEEAFRAPSNVQASLELQGEGLEIRKGGEALVPRGPITLNAQAGLRLSEEGAPQFIESPSATWRMWIGEGSLSAHLIEVRADAGPPRIEEGLLRANFDLAHLGRLLNALEAMPAEMRLAGTLQLGSEIKAVDGRMDVSSSIEGASVSVSKGGERLAPPSALSVSSQASIHMNEQGVVQRIDAPSVTWRTWLSEGSVSAQRVVMGEPNAPPNIEGAAARLEADLSQLANLLDALEWLPDGMALGGTARVESELSLEQQNMVNLSKANVDLTAFRFQQGEQSMPVQNLSLQTAGTMDLEGRSVHLPNLRLRLAAGALGLEEIRVSDWARAAETLSAKLDGRMDLARLVEMLGDFAALPEGTTLAGALSLAGDVRTAANLQSADLKMTISDLLVRADGETRIQEVEPVVLNLRAAVQPERIRLEALSLSARPLSFAVQGALSKEEARSTLEADGRLTLDLEVVAAYLQTLLELDIVMAGREEKPFRIAAAWQKDAVAEGLMAAEIEAGVHADRIETFGLVIEDLTVPLRMQNRRAEVAISGRLNDGQLDMRPALDFAAEPPMLSFPPESVLLEQVQLTEEMSNELLAKLHVLFRGASGVLGRMDLEMEYLEWPLAEEHAELRRLKGALVFQDLTIRSSAMWGTLLQFARVNERDMVLGDERIEFELRNNRIHCSPIRLDIGTDEKIVLVGSVGLDQTIDYTASMPVTEGMARSVGVNANDYTNYLAGASINVPIRGTASDPDIGAHVLRDMAADLARQAARRAVEERATRALEGLFGRPRQEEE